MTADEVLLIESGDLRIFPERGEVRNSHGESARLGPVNMKVLALLLDRAGQVVSRNEIFDSVWKNQTVSDDALTRCISDIRGELGRLSGHATFIETLPKRGYRWIADVRQGALPDTGARATTAAMPAGIQRLSRQRALLIWTGKGLSYLGAFVLLASAGVWLLDQFVRPGPVVVAVLPIRADATLSDLAARMDQRLTEFVIAIDRVDVLSRSAVESRPDNPFPYFYYEFGARWLIEGELRDLAGQTVLNIELVDARAGIVLLQVSEPAADAGHISEAGVDRALQQLKTLLQPNLEL